MPLIVVPFIFKCLSKRSKIKVPPTAFLIPSAAAFSASASFTRDCTRSRTSSCLKVKLFTSIFLLFSNSFMLLIFNEEVSVYHSYFVDTHSSRQLQLCLPINRHICNYRLEKEGGHSSARLRSPSISSSSFSSSHYLSSVD